MPSPKRRRASTKKTSSRLKTPFLFAGITAFILIGLWLCTRNVNPEPLTKDQILEKTDWTEEELTDTLSRQIALRGNLRGSKDVMDHLQKQVQHLPLETQKKIRHNTLGKSVEYAQEQYASLPAEQRKKVVDNLVNRLKQQRQDLKTMTADERAKLKERMNDPAVKNARTTAAQNALDKLTPAMRNELTPLVTEWVRVLENI